MIKLIITDIDGTLLKEGTSNLKKSYYDIIDKLIDKKIIIAVASGRNVTEIEGIFKNMRDKLYYISNNGAFITKGDKEYYKNTFKPKDAKMIINFLFTDIRFKDRPVLLSTADKGIFVTKKDAWIVEFLKKNYKSEGHIVDNFDSLYNKCLKINVYNNIGEVENIRNIVYNEWGDKFFIQLSGLYWLDICANGTNKGNAVKFLQKKYKINADETLVMGDNFNDIEMFKYAKYSFAPKNSFDEIKKLCRYVMPPYYEDGALKVLKTVEKYNFVISNK